MSKKAFYFALVALLIISTMTALGTGLGRGQKTLAGVAIHPARNSPLERGMAAPAAANAKARALISDFGRVPVFFVPNRGQTDDRVGFYVKGADKTIYFAPEGVTFSLSSSAGPRDQKALKRWVVKLDFLGSKQDVEPEGLEKTGASISYFRGKPEEWKTGLPAYSGVIYRDLWPGIDLAYKGEMDKLKYEFIVHPGADPSRIRLAYRGAERVALTEEGRLEVKTPVGSFEDDIPVAYQEVDGKRMGIPVTYSLEDVAESQNSAAASGPGITQADRSDSQSHAYGFVVGEYDRSRTLVLDPAVLVYCGYIGGASDQDFGYDIAVDGSGNAYITGPTSSDESSFPVNAGPDLTFNNATDAFVAKVDPTGTGFVYCGYIGGSDDDQGWGIAVDDSGNAYITGPTFSTEATFPVTVGPDLTHNGGRDVFVAKVNSSGTSLVYCGYIGGSANDGPVGIAIDASGNAYITGTAESTQATFPAKVGPDLTYNSGEADAFVAKVDSSGTGLVYCGYIGGSSYDNGCGIAVDSSGNAYVTGMTSSNQSTFPDVVGPDLTYNGGGDVYVAKVNSTGTGFVYCGYIGGADSEEYSVIAVDDSGNAYVSGLTTSTQATFPVTVGPDLTHNGWLDAFVAKVDSSGTGFVYCGYIGGSESESGAFLTVDKSGNAYISGITSSDESTFPVVDGPDLTYNGGWQDAFVAKVDSSGAALIYCGYIGGAGDDQGFGIAVDDSGNAYVTGNTHSDQSTFPVFVGPDLTLSGSNDAFVAKVGAIPGPPITSLLPDNADAGDPDLILSVIGSEFADGAIVMWAGSARPTTFVSEYEIDATIDALDLVAGKTIAVAVRNPNGGKSNSLPFTINNPLPSLTSVSPTHVTGGGAAFTLTVQGLNFVPNSVVRWNGSARTTTCISATELQAAIPSSDLATGGEAQVTVYNPAPSGGETTVLAVQVSSYTLSSTPASATVTAGQSATYTIQLTPQFGSFDASVSFSCAGLPHYCTSSFSSVSATPGAASVTTTLTLTTEATSSASGSASAGLLRATGFGTPAMGLLAIGLTMLLGNVIRKRPLWRLNRRWLAACALVCLAIVIGSCSAGGGDDNQNNPGTPQGTYQISVQGTSGNMTIPTVVTLVVN